MPERGCVSPRGVELVSAPSHSRPLDQTASRVRVSAVSTSESPSPGAGGGVVSAGIVKLAIIRTFAAGGTPVTEKSVSLLLLGEQPKPPPRQVLTMYSVVVALREWTGYTETKGNDEDVLTRGLRTPAKRSAFLITQTVVPPRKFPLTTILSFATPRRGWSTPGAASSKMFHLPVGSLLVETANRRLESVRLPRLASMVEANHVALKAS